jgi:hypothetical protein
MRDELKIERTLIPAYSISKGISSGLLSIKEYRSILNDHKSTDEQIQKRLQYLEALCRNIIKLEIENAVSKTKA